MTTEDRYQVETTLSRLGRLIDDRDWDGLHDLFTDVVEVDYTSLWGGEPEKLARETLIGRWRDVLTGLESTQHVIANVLAAIDGPTATATANVVGVHRLTVPNGGPLWTVGGTYHVRLARHAETSWRIEALTLRVSWADGNTAVMSEAARRAEART
jgi:hypothetical protein